MYLFGAGGHCKVVLEILENNGIPIDNIYVDDPDILHLFGYPVLSVSEFARSFNDKNECLIAIGDNNVRKRISESMIVNYGKVIHKFTSISKRTLIGEGSVIMSGVSVNSNTQIGNHCILNTNASIDHDCLLEDFVHISPNATLSGKVFVKSGSHIGSGATIIPKITIGKWATIGAGSTVIKDVPDYSVVVGNPAKIIRFNKP
jgi:sugar O-acyltransferase (sialic acid O-acetyltransferase NeuD family)